MMAAYFDAFLYLANWGTRHLMFRISRAALDTEYARQYCYTDAASLIETDDHLIISLYADRDPDDSWDETTGELGGMAAARSELLGGDHRLLYLAWLTGIQWDHADDEDTEPPVPAGLADLSGALRAVADFMDIDEDLIAVAAEASPPLKEEPAAGLADWIATLPAAEKDKLLTMVADGEGPQVQALLLRRFRGSAPDQNEPAQPARTAAQLWTAAGARRTVREESEARARRAEEERAATAKATAYNERLDHLAARAEAAWREAENLVETKKPRDYDLAVALLRDLSALARRDGDHDAFTVRSCNCGPGTSANHRSKNASTRPDFPSRQPKKAVSWAAGLTCAAESGGVHSPCSPDGPVIPRSGGRGGRVRWLAKGTQEK